MSVDVLQDKIRKCKNPSVVDFSLNVSDLPPHLPAEEGTAVKAYERFCRELLEALKGTVPAVRLGFTAFSVKPLRIATALGGFAAGAGFLYGIYTVIKRLVNSEVPLGFSSMMAAIVFFGGMIMVMLGLIGEYVGRIYISMNNSPQYVVKEKINLDE
jgi:hypothetical protein